METNRKIRFKRIKETDNSILTSASVPIAEGVDLSGWLIKESEGEVKVITPSLPYKDKNSGETKYQHLLYFSEKELESRSINKIKEEYKLWRDEEKILNDRVKLFKEFFKGRKDLFAKHWESSGGKEGYHPACKNAWKMGICSKPCYSCAHSNYLPLTDTIYLTHINGQDFRGKLFVVGIYPLREDSTSYFIAADFDGESALHQAKKFMEACSQYEIPAYLERSRSGAGYHVWIFFKEKVPAWKSRVVILEIMKKANIGSGNVEGFDRLFPNQDKPSGKGFGNLIALPLQGESVKKGTTVFLDPLNQYTPYPDQWDFLRTIRKIDEKKFDELIKLWNLIPNEERPLPTHTLGSQEALELVIANCEFIRYSIDNAKSLNEPLWYCMVSNLAVFEGGAEKIHEFSKPYPGYTRDETEAKIAHALRDTAPHNCETIRKEGFNCQRNCEVKSPAGLGYKANNVKQGG